MTNKSVYLLKKARDCFCFVKNYIVVVVINRSNNNNNISYIKWKIFDYVINL